MTIRVTSNPDGSFSVQRLKDVYKAEAKATEPVWMSYTPDQAAGWVQNKVTDLASAKAALTKMAYIMAMLKDLVLANQD